MEDGQVMLYSVSTLLHHERRWPGGVDFHFLNVGLFLFSRRIELCECPGGEDSLPMVGFQREGESQLCVPPRLHCGVGFRCSPIRGKYFSRRTSKYFFFWSRLKLILEVCLDGCHQILNTLTYFDRTGT